MKKERNCGAPYPIYPYPAPNMINPMGTPMNMPMNTQTNDNIMASINNLEKRVSNLENMLGNNYNSSNFQIM